MGMNIFGSNTDLGPGVGGAVNTGLVVGSARKSTVSGDGPTILATLAAASVNDWNPTGWGNAVKNVRITPFAGGATITGIAAITPLSDSIQLFNESTTDTITFANLSSSSFPSNQFFCLGNANVTLPPGGGASMNRVNNQWRFF